MLMQVASMTCLLELTVIFSAVLMSKEQSKHGISLNIKLYTQDCLPKLVVLQVATFLNRITLFWWVIETVLYDLLTQLPTKPRFGKFLEPIEELSQQFMTVPLTY